MHGVRTVILNHNNTETNPVSVPLHPVEEKVETAQIKSKSFVSKQPRGTDLDQAGNELCA